MKGKFIFPVMWFLMRLFILLPNSILTLVPAFGLKFYSFHPSFIQFWG